MRTLWHWEQDQTLPWKVSINCCSFASCFSQSRDGVLVLNHMVPPWVFTEIVFPTEVSYHCQQTGLRADRKMFWERRWWSCSVRLPQSHTAVRLNKFNSAITWLAYCDISKLIQAERLFMDLSGLLISTPPLSKPPTAQRKAWLWNAARGPQGILASDEWNPPFLRFLASHMACKATLVGLVLWSVV